MLFSIFMIYKGFLSLGDSKIIETLMTNDFYLDTFGALECMYIFKINVNIKYIDDPEIY